MEGLEGLVGLVRSAAEGCGWREGGCTSESMTYAGGAGGNS